MEQQLPFLLALAAIAQHVATISKRYMSQQNAVKLTDEQANIMVQLTAILAGVALALVVDVNILESFENVDNSFGTILTGVFVGFGAEILNPLVDVIYDARDLTRRIRTPDAA